MVSQVGSRANTIPIRQITLEMTRRGEETTHLVATKAMQEKGRRDASCFERIAEFYDSKEISTLEKIGVTLLHIFSPVFVIFGALSAIVWLPIVLCYHYCKKGESDSGSEEELKLVNNQNKTNEALIKVVNFKPG